MNKKFIYAAIIIAIGLLAIYLFVYIPKKDQQARLDQKRTECTELGIERAKTENLEAEKTNKESDQILVSYSGQQYYYNQKMDSCLYQSTESIFYLSNGKHSEYLKAINLANGEELIKLRTSNFTTPTTEEIANESKSKAIIRRIFSGENYESVKNEILGVSK